jgi:hypothetical protein
MKRPDLATLAGVNAACQLFRRAGASHLVIRKGYRRDHIRLLRCRTCGEEFSERRGSALFNTKLPEPKAAEVINHLGAGCSLRATARRCQRDRGPPGPRHWSTCGAVPRPARAGTHSPSTGI